MTNSKLLVSLILLICSISILSAQKYASDKIIRKDGNIINCKINSIDNVKIDFLYHKSGNARKTFILIKDVDSYIYKDIRINPHDPEVKKLEDYVHFQSWKNPTPELFETYEQPSTIIRLSLLVPSLLIENKVSPKTTLVVQFQTGFIYSEMTDNRGNTTSSFDFTPTIRFGPRFYASLASRRGYGKRIDYFSGTYISLPLSVTFYREYKILGLSALGGFQRTLGKRGYWNIGIGAGLTGVNGDFNLQPTGEFGLGVILTK